MRIICPLCGPRDRREFYYSGSAGYLDRPAADAPPEAWDDYLHLRDNPAGVTADLWYHEAGCSAWLRVTRNTVTHEIFEVALVAPPPALPPAAPDFSGPLQPAEAAALPAKTSAKSPARKKKSAS